MMPDRREAVVMVTTSYPRFPGDTIGTFMEPIAKGVASRGYDVHLVLPWHPRLTRREREGRVFFHPFKYAPVAALNVFGYAGALREDVRLRGAALAAAPFALAAAWRETRRVARRVQAILVHGHWVIPGGVIAAAAAGSRPLVVSLHGSDVYVAEHHLAARLAARRAFRQAAWVTACSDDLRLRAVALGAPAGRSETLPYGVDASRFRPDAAVRAAVRQRLGLDRSTPLLFTAGRFVRKKGFEYLIDAVAELRARQPDVVLAIGGSGDLDSELRERARARGVADRVRFLGVLAQDEVASHLSAADIAVVPSVRDDAGNVDGLPNVVMESLASGTPLVATTAGGIASVAEDGRTALLVPERNVAALAAALGRLLDDPEAAGRIGGAARQEVLRRHTWDRVAARFDEIYAQVRHASSHGQLAAMPGLPSK